MKNTIGIRRENVDVTERRAPLTPDHVRRIVRELSIRVLVAPSETRVFTDEEYAEAGAEITADLSPCNVIFGVKEVHLDLIHSGYAYCFFSHTIKAQRYNMPMLTRIIEKRATLIDYERITTDQARRLVYFGDFAGYAGIVDTLWALGQRLDYEDVPNPFSTIRQAFRYESVDEAVAALRHAGHQIRTEGIPAAMGPFVCVFTGRGSVSRGAQKMFGNLPVVRLLPDDLPGLQKSYSRNTAYAVEFNRPQLYKPRDAGRAFDKSHFEANPKDYVSALEDFAPYATVIVNGIVWFPRYPRLLSKAFVRDQLAAGGSLPRVIGDITCDVGGSVEFTERATTSENPVYVYDPVTDTTTDGVAGNGPVVLAVDKLPSEFPREASTSFGDDLMPFVAALARADYREPFESLELPAPIRRAIIAHDGRLTENFKYLNAHLLLKDTN